MYYGEIEKHIIVDEEPSSFKKKYLGRGFTGECYLTEDNKVYKHFHNRILDFDNLKYFTFIKNKDFAFPETLVYQKERNNNNLIGYIMPYFDGVPIRKIDSNLNILDFINSVVKSEKEIQKLSNYDGVEMFEVNTSNVLFTNNNEIKFIDTDLYNYSPSDAGYILLEKNIKEFGNLILCMYANGYPYNNHYLNNLFERCVCDGTIKPSIMLIEQLKELQKSFDNIQTINDYKNSLQLIKRS